MVEDDYYIEDDWQCCRETATIVYLGDGPISVHCYRGDPGYTQTLQNHGYLRKCNASVMIFGVEEEKIRKGKPDENPDRAGLVSVIGHSRAGRP